MKKQFITLLKKLIKEVKVKSLPKKHCLETNITGKYFSDTFSVEVCGTVFNKCDIGLCFFNSRGKIPKNQVLKNLIHELGHHFMSTKFSKTDLIKWKYLNHKSMYDSHYVKDYGKTNHKEDFATCFEMYLFSRPRDPILKEKMKFIEDRLIS